MKRILGSLVIAALFSLPALATTVRKLSFEQLVLESELIVHGKVVGSHSYMMPSRGWILTDTLIRVLDAVKGQPGQLITVTELGGVVGDKGMIVPGTARFRVGEEAVVFLKNVSGQWRTSGLAQGKFSVMEERGEKLVVPVALPAGFPEKILLKDLIGRVRNMQTNPPALNR